ncbi:hypothetical protein DERF_000085 [Dermatophagoides farinae]|uniref:Uncharacterized protein n=1 Tax=Dermatophagoides farinae TaxID=6954 RepID=A0A922I7X8_DERFA|nr:hypothetical protein DERF_000085 [Dermatophagoides farinae]
MYVHVNDHNETGGKKAKEILINIFDPNGMNFFLFHLRAFFEKFAEYLPKAKPSLNRPPPPPPPNTYRPSSSSLEFNYTLKCNVVNGKFGDKN